jgi:hypothetical protein
MLMLHVSAWFLTYALVGLVPPDGPLVEGPPPLPPAVPRVVMSEVQANPLLHDDRAGEFVEVVNLSREPVRLADLTLLLPSGTRAVPVRPAAPLIHPGEVVLLTPLGSLPGEAALKGMRLPNDAGRLELFWRQTRVDVAQWHKKAPWPKPRPGVALERTRPGADGERGSAWRQARQVLHGVERASPGRVEWLCPDVVGTALEGKCVPPAKSRTASRCRVSLGARSCPVVANWHPDVQLEITGQSETKPVTGPGVQAERRGVQRGPAPGDGLASRWPV